MPKSIADPAAPTRASPGRRRLVTATDPAALRETWTELAERTGNVFSTWEWADTWLRRVARAPSARVAALHDGAETVAILPLCAERRHGLPVVRFLGHGVADELGPVCDPGDLDAAVAALCALVPAGGALLAERLPGDRPWADELGGRLLATEASPVVDLSAEGDWEAYLSARSANFRQQVRRRERKLTGRLGVRFRLSTDPGRLDADLDALFRLHEARWGSHSLTFSGALEDFHREFAATALARGWLRLWLAEIEGTPVAAWYGFRFAGVESFYQSGRDPSWDHAAVGAGLLEHTIREAFADGMREYRLLRGDERYKSRYATYDHGVCTVAAGRGLTGRASVAAGAVLVRSRQGRRLLKGTGEEPG